MPRKSKVQHPLREIRGFLKLNQEDFGARVGVSAETIKSIETGRLKLSPTLAIKIANATGADPACLKVGHNPIDFRGASYGPDSYSLFKMGPTDEVTSKLVEFTRLYFEAAALAARDTGNLFGAIGAFDAFLEDFVKDFGCDKEAGEHLKRLTLKRFKGKPHWIRWSKIRNYDRSVALDPFTWKQDEVMEFSQKRQSSPPMAKAPKTKKR